jgi:hypothetical protein
VTLGAAFRAMGFSGYGVTHHGLHAAAHTMLYQRLWFDPGVLAEALF